MRTCIWEEEVTAGIQGGRKKLYLGYKRRRRYKEEQPGVGWRQAVTGGVSKHEGKERCETDPDTQRACRQEGGRERVKAMGCEPTEETKMYAQQRGSRSDGITCTTMY